MDQHAEFPEERAPDDEARADDLEATEPAPQPVSDEPEAEQPAPLEEEQEPQAEQPAPVEEVEEEQPATAADDDAFTPAAEEDDDPLTAEVAAFAAVTADDDEGDAEILGSPPSTEPSAELVADVEDAFEGVDVEAATAEAPEAVLAPAGDAAPEAAGETATEEAEEVIDDWVPGEWYVVHTYAGYENKVKADLESRVASMNMEDSIFEVVIPMEEVMEIKGGKKQMVPRKVFPGYLLVRMDLNDDSWYVVRNTPGVTGFVGSGSKPIPLSEREVDKILRRKGEAERPKPTVEWSANDSVRVTTGPFANFQGTISEVDLERQKVKVLVNIFGRETPVELAFDQIAKV